MSSHVISWVSKQLTKDRNTGDFENYGERLYVEALHDLARRGTEVRHSFDSIFQKGPSFYWLK